MKLSDFRLLNDREEHDTGAFVKRLNDTRTSYPRTRTVHDVFREQAAKGEDALAVASGAGSLTYGELDRRSNRLANLLVSFGLPPEAFVGLMLERSPEMVVGMLGVLKSGGAYLPINPDFPFERVKYLLRDTRAPVLIGSKTSIRELNRLQWECPDLRLILCIDSNNVHGEIEPPGGLADLQIWEHVAREAFDDVSAGGWKDSYTGDWLSREVMDEYGENIRAKLEPHLSRSSRVFEVGCASGISMFRLAPRVSFYYGTDISPGIAQWADKERRRRGIENARVECLAAHEIDRVTERGFDVVVINSVIECFNGHNYLRDVLRKAIDLLGEQGYLFLGNLWDQDTKEAFIASLLQFKEAHAGEGYRTKVDREDELYIARAFLDDLRHELPEIAEIECSKMLGTTESELSRFGYDALVRIDKRRAAAGPTPRARNKHQLDARALAAASDAPPMERAEPGSLAYLIYTSGSSGAPKGVMIEHRSILRLVLDTNYIKLGPDDRLLQTGSLAFDASTFEIWGPLLTGGRVCFARGSAVADPRRLSEAIREHEITTVFLTTALFNRLVETDISFFASVRTVLTGGEKASVRHFNTLRRTYPSLRLLHVYGPTESTTFSTWFPVERTYERDIPIGGPLANTTVYILNEQGELQPPGVPGELCIGGDGLARGYWGDPVLTAKKFVPHPLAENERLYRSGDLAQWTPDGDVEFIGRLDRQVKIRGYRVEPEEVERCLLLHPDVEHVAVLCSGTGEDRMLVAYASGKSSLTSHDVHLHLKHHLPLFMVPGQVVVLPALPLNPSGKVDRDALPAPEAAREASPRPGAPSQSELEKKLAALWTETLGVRDVQATDSFFELGGHSLKVPKLVSLIQTRIGIEIPYVAIYTADTLRELSNYITDRMKLAEQGIDPRLAEEPLVQLSGAGAGKVFAFPPGSGFCLAYVNLARMLEPCSFYGLTFLETSTRFEEYLELITGIDPEGPYTLFGFSAGGKLAFDVAAHLEAAGKKVSAVVMLDAARYLEPIEISEEETRRVAAEFLDGVTSSVLKEKGYRKMSAYRAYAGGRVEKEVLDADIHLVLQENSPTEFRDQSGRVIASATGWAELTRGAFKTYYGSGKHRAMLEAAHIHENARQLRMILDATTLKTRAT